MIFIGLQMFRFSPELSDILLAGDLLLLNLFHPFRAVRPRFANVINVSEQVVCPA
jgi:hypothetical protein